MKCLRTVAGLGEIAQVRVPRIRTAEPRGGACGSGPGRAGGRRGLQGSDPAPGRCDSQARKGAGLARGRGTSPCEPEALLHVSEARLWGCGPPLGGPKFLAAPLRPPSCLRPDSRGGRGGDQAGSGCAAAALPAQVGECGPGRINALLKGRPGSRAQERRGHLKGHGKAQLEGPGGGHPGASLEPRAGSRVPRGGREPRSRRRLEGPRGPPRGLWGRAVASRGGFVRNCVLALDWRLNQVSGAWESPSDS